MATLAKAPARKSTRARTTTKAPVDTAANRTVVPTTLTITSKNYSSWSLRGWLLVRFAGLPFAEHVLPPR